MLVKERIAAERKKRGLSTMQLAEMIHVNKGTINRYENGSIKRIPIDILKTLASIFEYDFDDFVGEDPKYSMFADRLGTIETSLDNDDIMLLKWYHSLPIKHREFIKEVVIDNYHA